MKRAKARGALAALLIGHVAGMIDLAALPLWVNTLTTHFGYGAAQAGALPTLFLTGVVLASTLMARRRVTDTRLAAPGYLVTAVALAAVPFCQGFALHLALHLAGGLGVGVALSLVHGVMGRSENPHKLFAGAGLAFGLFSILFLGGVPQLLGAFGATGFFLPAGATMLVAALALAMFLPRGKRTAPERRERVSLPRHVRLAIAGVTGMALVQGMVFSFLVEAGHAKGFAPGHIESVLIALGFVNLVPPILATALETRLPALGVARIGPLVQGALALGIMLAGSLVGYALPAVFFAAVMIFTHTFVFGFLARQDPTGRAVAATPAMLMAGSALAPFIGGVLVQNLGFAGIGIAAAAIGLTCSALFTAAGLRLHASAT